MQRRPKSKWRRALERVLTRASAALFAVLVRLLPLGALRRVADAVAWLIGVLTPSRRRIAIENMRRVFGDRYSARQYRALVAEVTRGLCRTMVELLKCPYLSAEQIRALVQPQGLEHLQAALAQGRGAILVTAHFGNWELMGAMLGAYGLPLTVIARDSQERLTASLINRARESHGTEVLARDDARSMLRALRANRILGILPDQHAADNSIIVEFLGRPAATAVGVATLAARTGAPVVPGFCIRRPDGRFDAVFYPPLALTDSGDREADIRANTILVNQVLEAQIRAHPEQWLWLHRRWKVDPSPTAAGPVASGSSPPQEQCHDR